MNKILYKNKNKTMQKLLYTIKKNVIFTTGFDKKKTIHLEHLSCLNLFYCFSLPNFIIAFLMELVFTADYSINNFKTFITLA